MPQLVISSTAKSIVFIRLSSFGDVVLAALKARELVRQFQESNLKLTFVVRSNYGELARLLFEDISFVRIVEIPPQALLGPWNLWKWVRSDLGPQDLIFDFHNNLRTWIIRLACSGKICYLEPKVVKKIKELLLFVTRRWGRTVLSSLGQKFKAAERLSFYPKKIFICDESLWAQKCWSRQNYVVLTKILCAAGYQVSWVGQKRDSFFSENLDPVFRNYIQTGQLKDLRGSLRLNELRDQLIHSSLLIGNDSGLLHFAEFFNVPVMMIMGPTVPEYGFSPRLKESRIIQSSLWCRPCSKYGRFCHRVKSPYRCLTEIKPEYVYAELLRMLPISN